MRLQDYLLAHEEFDWPLILADWRWLLPHGESAVLLMSRYGDLFLEFDEGGIHMLDVGNGSLEKVAESSPDFWRKINEAESANNWLMIPLVDQLVAAGNVLEPGRCYSFIIPPVLGGEYTVENTASLKVQEHFGVYASIHDQIKELPDGAQVRLRVSERGDR
jgi:hypothetical protein